MQKVYIILFAAFLFMSGKNVTASAEEHRMDSDSIFYIDNGELYCPETDDFTEVNLLDGEREIFTSTVVYNFNSKVKIDRVECSSSNVVINSIIFDDKEIKCELSGFVDCSEVSLQFYYNNEYIDSTRIFFAKSNDNILYSSAVSLDTAKKMAGQKRNYELVDESETTTNFVEEQPAVSPRIGASGSISGTLRWTDEQGNLHPLIGAKVGATMSGSWWNVSTYTDSTGFYRIDYSGIWHMFGGKPMVHIYPESDNVKVHGSGTYDKQKEFSDNGDNRYSYTFSPISDGDM